jgi:acetyltransferase-like isoleucine patch superfamily enzyme
MIFDKRLIEHMVDLKRGKGEIIPRSYRVIIWLYSNGIFCFFLRILELVFGFILALPVPIYRDIALAVLTHLPGSPYFLGNYLRGVYWCKRLKCMKSNVIIEQGVIIRNPDCVELDEFILLDKNVLLEAGEVRIGKRVHIAENCVISGGGAFIMEEYSCLAHSSAVVTASDTPNYGFRASGPMVPWDQRSVKFGKVVIRKDAFVGMGVRILPDVTINHGAVIAAGAVVNKDVDAWTIVAGVPAKVIGNREPVTFPDI